MPGTGFKKTARLWKKDVDASYERPHSFVKYQMEHKSHQPSYLSDVLANAVTEEDESMAKNTAHTMYAGGADTVRQL